MSEERKMTVVGLMSGSSLDGLDVAVCSFTFTNETEFVLGEWSLRSGATIPYPPTWKARLRSAPHLPGRELWRLHADLGRYFGAELRRYLTEETENVELIGSHGHTLFHDPERRFTTQVGDGMAIAAAVGLPTIDQLRTADIYADGQGAPIAPIADKYLFPDHHAFLNLGGIANISLKGADENLIAGDVSGANQILDQLAAQLGKPYDDGGEIARSGQLLPDLLLAIKDLAYHREKCPKSLDNAWVREVLWPVIDGAAGETADVMHTFCHFLASEIHRVLEEVAQTSGLAPQPLKVLVTGGGARNSFMLDCLRQQVQSDDFPLGYEAADPRIGDFKEAAMVALSALLRYLERPNALASATGAARDTINGALYLPTA